MSTELEIIMWVIVFGLYGMSGIWTLAMGFIIFKQKAIIEQLKKKNEDKTE